MADTDSPRPSTQNVPIGADTFVSDIETAFQSGDLATVSSLVEKDFLAAWFGLPPSRMADILSTLLNNPEFATPFVRVISLLVFAEQTGELDTARMEGPLRAAAEQGYAVEHLVLIGHMFGARLRGRLVDALAIANDMGGNYPFAPVFDPTMGWALFTAVQCGVTAMLAGDFSYALTNFALARMHVPIPRLGFLVRDACAKAALIEVLYGDPERADALLGELEKTPRTQSWVEEGTDVIQTVVKALLRSTDADEALSILHSIQLSAVGEIWPFYLVAVQRLLLKTGDQQTRALSLSMYEDLPLPHVEGQGFTGSAIPISAALNCLTAGDMETAREWLERADQRIPATEVLVCLYEFLMGRPREALRRASKARLATRGLRFLEIWRLSVVAASSLTLGDASGCEAALKSATSLPGGPRKNESAYFSTEVRKFAADQVKNWPVVDESSLSSVGFDIFPTPLERLTDRELEVLRALAEGKTRKEISEAEFVSINTLKAHLRGLYRKLGVRSRNAAVLEGQRRGLL